MKLAIMPGQYSVVAETHIYCPLCGKHHEHMPIYKVDNMEDSKYIVICPKTEEAIYLFGFRALVG